MRRKQSGRVPELKKGFTLIELIVIIIIVGILVTFAAPQYSSTKERALDKEAQANVRLILAAEKMYMIEHGKFYPENTTGTINNIKTINDNLKLSIPTANTRSWNYTVEVGNAADPADSSCCVIAQRTSKAGYCWKIYHDGASEDSNPINTCTCSK